MLNGRVILYTGNGKGKTTAALGLVFRALGHGLRVCVIQFIKGKGEYGERLFAGGLDSLEWHVCGQGFVFKKEENEADRRVAREGFRLAREKIESDLFDLVILDEITYLPHYGFLDVDEIVDLLHQRPPRLHMILTGRNAHRSLIDVADTVTEMDAVKHAYEKGVKAQKGIEF